MSWSLSLRNGDLVVDRNKLESVTGSKKLVQDLRCHLLEKMGTDRMHPDFGSVLDGGVRSDGVEINGVIGESDPDIIQSFISTELNRIIREHQKKQLARLEKDQFTYNKMTLTNEELLDSAQVQMVMNADVMMIHILLITSTGRQETIKIPIIK